MKAIQVMAVAALLAASGSAMNLAQAQKADIGGIGRTEVLRHDIDAGREIVQVRVDFAPGAAFPKHTHPGEEIAYVLEGTMEYELRGKQVTVKTGEALFIPAGVVHSARNVGATKASELATYHVEKGKPIVVMVK